MSVSGNYVLVLNKFLLQTTNPEIFSIGLIPFMKTEMEALCDRDLSCSINYAEPFERCLLLFLKFLTRDMDFTVMVWPGCRK